MRWWVFVACLLSGVAGAQSWPHRTCLGAFTSSPGQELQMFLGQVGKSFERYTRQTGHEACGVVGHNGTQWSILAFSDGVQRGCTMHHSEVVAGFSSTGQTLHSHPDTGSVWLTERDREWNTRHGQRLNTRMLVIRPGFSPGDLRAGPGWLVQGGALHYQDGSGRSGQRMGLLAPQPAQADTSACPGPAGLEP